jgi:hypothetical protein
MAGVDDLEAEEALSRLLEALDIKVTPYTPLRTKHILIIYIYMCVLDLNKTKLLTQHLSL